MKHLLPFLLAMALAGTAPLAEASVVSDAVALRERGQELCEAAFATDRPDTLRQQALALFEEARDLLEAEKDTDPRVEDELVTTNALIFWTSRMIPVDIEDDSKPATGRAPEDASAAAGGDAKSLLAGAIAFEEAHEGDRLLCLVRYFEVAKRFPGTAEGLDAHERSIAIHEELIARAKADSPPSAADPDDGDADPDDTDDPQPGLDGPVIAPEGPLRAPFAIKVWGVERSPDSDVLYFANKERLSGKILDEELSFNSTLGPTKFSRDKLAAVYFGIGIPRTAIVVTVGADCFRGDVTSKSIELELPTGERKRVACSGLWKIYFRQRADELRGVPHGQLVQLREGSRFTATLKFKPFKLRTQVGEMVVDPDATESLYIPGTTRDPMTVRLKNGDVVVGTAKLDIAEFAADLGFPKKLGPEAIDTVYFQPHQPADNEPKLLGITRFYFNEENFGSEWEEVLAGLRISSVEYGYPSSRAGLEVGDVLTLVDGKRLTTTRQFLDLCDKVRSGHFPDGIELTVRHTTGEIEILICKE